MTEEELLCAINKDLKNKITWQDIYSNEIELNHLKRIDKVFNKGLFYYSDPTTPKKDASISIFFRKDSFTSDLNLGARQRVREFEEIKTQISALSKLSNFNLSRILPTFSVENDPKQIAFSLRNEILPSFVKGKRDFLKAFINKLGEKKIFVFEFVDTANKKEKAKIDGFFIKPNAIVLKRNQESLSRELFTLAHELGHYFLYAEDIDEISFEEINVENHTISEIENWCNSFAYNLLLGDVNANELDNISHFDYKIDYGFDIVTSIADRTHLSQLAIFTNLFLQKKLVFEDYDNIREELFQKQQEWIESMRCRREKAIELGIEFQGRNPKPITADLVYSVYNRALNTGIISEYEYCTALKVKPTEITKLFYGGHH